jgi:uncharacterized membrane protein
MTLIFATVAAKSPEIIFLSNQTKRLRHPDVAIKKTSDEEYLQRHRWLGYRSSICISTRLQSRGRDIFRFFEFRYEALARVPPAQGIAAMQSINVVVLNRWFFAVFFGTTVGCLALAITSFVRWQKPGAGYLLVGGLLYLIGTILVTIACNVPLNDALAAVDPSSADAGPVWTNYLKTWTAWNHVRTITALAAAASFIIPLCRASSWVDLAGSETSSPTLSATLPHKREDWRGFSNSTSTPVISMQ